jgi:hypothetical protein
MSGKSLVPDMVSSGKLLVLPDISAVGADVFGRKIGARAAENAWAVSASNEPTSRADRIVARLSF